MNMEKYNEVKEYLLRYYEEQYLEQYRYIVENKYYDDSNINDLYHLFIMYSTLLKQ